MIFSVVIPAALAGFTFGFLLQKGNVAKFDTIVGQLLLKNFTMAKVMLTAIVVGSIGVYAMIDYGLIPFLSLKAISMTRILVGATFFGIGMAILGYCPGTAIAAWATGAQDALFGILGMLTGAFLFIKFQSYLISCMPSSTMKMEPTVARTLGVSHWVIIAVLVTGLLIMVYADKKLKILK